MAATPPASMLMPRLIVGAMALGLTAFTGVAAAVALTGTAAGSPGLALPLGVAVAAVLVMCLIASVVVPMGIRRATRAAASGADSPEDAGAIIDGQWHASVVIRSAMAGGPGLFGAVAVLLTGELVFALVPLVSLLILALAFPTRAARERFTRLVLETP